MYDIKVDTEKICIPNSKKLYIIKTCYTSDRRILVKLCEIRNSIAYTICVYRVSECFVYFDKTNNLTFIDANDRIRIYASILALHLPKTVIKKYTNVLEGYIKG